MGFGLGSFLTTLGAGGGCFMHNLSFFLAGEVRWECPCGTTSLLFCFPLSSTASPFLSILPPTPPALESRSWNEILDVRGLQYRNEISRVCNSKLLSIMISNQKTPQLRIYAWSSDLQIPCNCPGVDCWSAFFQWGPGRGFDGAWTATWGRAFSWETVICSIRLSATEVPASTSVTSYRIRAALCKTSQIKISYAR